MALSSVLRLPGDDCICAGNHAGDLDGLGHEAEKVEAVMILAALTTDAEGKPVAFRLPPAIAVAIVNAFESGDPVRYAKSRMPR